MAKILLAKFFGVGMPLDLRQVDTKQGEYLTELRESGFLDFVPTEQPQADTGFVAVDSFAVVDGCVVQSWKIKVDPVLMQSRIDELKAELAESDYKVTKCYEASLVGESLPYNITELHRERQSIRDEINRLEVLID